MTREEQRAKAAHEYIQSDSVAAGNEILAFGDFINGAKWADFHPQWIPVEEKLPPYNERVLVFYGVDRYIGIAMLEDVVGQQTFWNDGRKAVFHITHWRHLPAPPKKKDGQGWVPASSGRPA